ncbi:hypothetical protein [Psychrosphaera algicola]|uniref:Solute-binding protein family 3/N-terminal domain-containing protein n=1 Tax=Psychrosphaera algicola TaxID=3023714 RepID=A0ABT5FAB3_9GAMM|nr:hypothetical protein [Psychrosphaera sp. G1-22]MDC2888064.1 hypothetical protein [Psychrosphaera sp. G1-22]
MLKILLAFLALTLPFQCDSRNFVIGVEDIAYYPLFDFQKDGDSYTKALFTEFGKQSGHTFTYLPLPIKRFNKWLIEDNIDFKYPDNERWNPSGQQVDSFIYSDSTIRLVAGTLTAVDRNLTEKDVKVLGTLLGFYPTQWIEQIKSKQVQLYENSSTLMLLQQVLRGQVDGIDLEPSVVQYHLKKLGKPGALVVNKNLTYEVYDFYLSTIKHQDIIVEFNQFLKDNQPLLAELRRKFEIVDHRPYLK